MLTLLAFALPAFAGDAVSPEGAAAWEAYSTSDLQERPEWTPPFPPADGPNCLVPTVDGDKLLGYNGGCSDGTAEGRGEAWIESADGAWLVYIAGEFRAGSMEGTFLRVMVRHPEGFTGALFFRGTAVDDNPVSGTLFTGAGLRYQGGVSKTFGLLGQGELRLPNGDTATGEWNGDALLKGRRMYADNGDWEEIRSRVSKNGTVHHRVVDHYYAPPLGTVADCVPGNDVRIVTPGSKHWISATVTSVGESDCGVLIDRYGGTETSYPFSQLVTTYTASQKEADQAYAAMLRDAYNSVMNAPAPAEDLFQSYLDAQDAYARKRAEENGEPIIDPCADAATSPSYCH